LLIIFFCPCFVCRPAPTLWITLRHPLPQALISATRQRSPTLSDGAPCSTLSPKHLFWRPGGALQPSPVVLSNPLRRRWGSESPYLVAVDQSLPTTPSPPNTSSGNPVPLSVNPLRRCLFGLHDLHRLVPPSLATLSDGT
jgi:hypothetical protein